MGGVLEAQPFRAEQEEVESERGGGSWEEVGGGPVWGSGKLALGETKEEQHWQAAGLGGSREQERGCVCVCGGV